MARQRWRRTGTNGRRGSSVGATRHDDQRRGVHQREGKAGSMMPSISSPERASVADGEDGGGAVVRLTVARGALTVRVCARCRTRHDEAGGVTKAMKPTGGNAKWRRRNLRTAARKPKIRQIEWEGERSSRGNVEGGDVHPVLPFIWQGEEQRWRSCAWYFSPAQATAQICFNSNKRRKATGIECGG